MYSTIWGSVGGVDVAASHTFQFTSYTSEYVPGVRTSASDQ